VSKRGILIDVPNRDCLEVYFSWQRFEYKKANPLRMP
jgi:hypothetical protein